MSSSSNSTPSQYLAPSQSPLYAPVPVFYDPRREAYVPVGFKAGDELLSGCSCEKKGRKCMPHPRCRCAGDINPDGDKVCDSSRCAPCKSDRTGCIVRPGCECRRNAGSDHMHVCNELCHPNGKGCGHKYNVTPREASIKIVELPGMGFGVRAAKRIPMSTCLGTYSGVLKTGLELLESAQVIEIASEHSLGIAAYIDPSLHVLSSSDGDTSDADDASYTNDADMMDVDCGTDDASTLDDDTASTGSTDEERLYRVNAVLAAHIVNDKRHILVSWVGHTVPTWIPDTPTVTHTLHCKNIVKDLEDDSSEFQKTIGPEAYTMRAGSANPPFCCKNCTKEDNDGRDKRVFVDAYSHGNWSRYMTHSCDANVMIVFSRFGSHPKAPPVPLLFTSRSIKRGEILSIPYWNVKDITIEQREKLKSQRPDERHNYNDCLCGSKHCSGWIALPPRAALLHAGVPEAEVKKMWLDDYVKKTLVQA